MDRKIQGAGMLVHDFEAAMRQERFVPLMLIPYKIGTIGAIQHLAFHEGDAILLDARHHGDTVVCTLYFNWRPRHMGMMTQASPLRELLERLIDTMVPTGEGEVLVGRLRTEQLVEDLALLREHGSFLGNWIRRPELKLRTADDPVGKRIGFGGMSSTQQRQLERIPLCILERMA